ncbi:MAG: hypothetical protein B6D64_15120 [Bacteroidetes bacterium 4484_276]|nr:MAG: hypothetical protein B6D64_15120 [Bacteroidetes bacterium 4484_276]
MIDKKRSPEKIDEPAVCPKCGKGFTCSPAGKCWCNEVLVPPAKLNEIKDKFDSCLCPDCLKSYS